MKAGEIVYLKPTGEKAVVLSELSGLVQILRGVTSKENGTSYVKDELPAEAFESFDEQLNREFNELEQIEKQKDALRNRLSAKAEPKLPLLN